MKQILMSALALCVAATFVGCGEREQSASYSDGKYRGKPDGRPWDGQPSSYVQGEWKQGDRESWENNARSRSQTQNEYGRIGH